MKLLCSHFSLIRRLCSDGSETWFISKHNWVLDHVQQFVNWSFNFSRDKTHYVLGQCNCYPENIQTIITLIKRIQKIKTKINVQEYVS